MNTSTIGGPSVKKKYVNDDLEERERRISSNVVVTPNPSTITKAKRKTESINPFISKNQYDSVKVEEEKTNPETINKFESLKKVTTSENSCNQQIHDIFSNINTKGKNISSPIQKESLVKNNEVKEDIVKDIIDIQDNNTINKKSTFKLFSSQFNNDIIQNVNNNSNNHDEFESRIKDSMIEEIKPPAINIYEIDKFDEPHGIVNKKESKRNLEEKKNNFFKDIFFTGVEQKCIPTTKNLKPKEDLDEDVLKVAVEIDIFDQIKDREELRQKVKRDLVNYENVKKNIHLCLNISQVFQEFNCEDYIKYRKVYKDGDSFFRAFMFSYLEKLILSQNVHEIKILIYEIENQISTKFIYRDCRIPLLEVIIIFQMILEYTKNNQYYEAIKTLNRGFCMNQHFTNSLIKIMKILIGEFISLNYMNFNNEELLQLINEYYFDKETKEFKYKEYITNNVLLMQTEPDLFQVFLTPYVFKNASLKIYYNEENKIKPSSFTIQSYNKEKGIDENKQIEIELVFSLKKGYSIIYYEDYFQKNIITFSYELVLQSNIKAFTIVSENVKCERCTRICNVISFKKLEGQVFCLECVKQKIGQIMSKRITYFINEEYSHLEYYIRPIALCYDGKYELTDKDVNELIGMDIEEDFKLILSSSCIRCRELVGLDSPNKELSCGCKLCVNCIGKIVTKDSNEKIILNYFEKSQLELTPTPCLCGNPFNLQEGIKLLYTEGEIQDYRSASFERLRDYARRYCMKCAKKLELKNFVPMPTCKPKDEEHNPYTLYENGDIIIEPDECAVSPHILCLKCWEDNKNQVKAMKREKKLLKEDKYSPINCLICGKVHKIIIIKERNIACSNCILI